MRVRFWLRGHSLEWARGASRGRHLWLLKRVLAIGAVVNAVIPTSALPSVGSGGGACLSYL